MIGSTLTEEGRIKLCGLLQRSMGIFAWKPADMTGVPRHIAEHHLNVREGCSPVRQKKRGQAAYRKWQYRRRENFMTTVDGCGLDFNFKRRCPKDGYPLPEIDWKVESLCGFLSNAS
ncbi:hypothetical protein Tco_0694901 [Tanacetum coccineum]